MCSKHFNERDIAMVSNQLRLLLSLTFVLALTSFIKSFQRAMNFGRKNIIQAFKIRNSCTNLIVSYSLKRTKADSYIGTIKFLSHKVDKFQFSNKRVIKLTCL